MYPAKKLYEGSQTEKPVTFSLFYFANEEPSSSVDRYRLLIEGARFADRHGFEAVWTPERHFDAFGGLYPNPSVASAALATITSHIHIRAGSVVLPLHNPIRIAEEWALVDNLSRGRVGIAFASGWHANDFTFFPDNYVNRKELTWQGIETIRRLWQGESLEVQSATGKRLEIQTFPRPIQPSLPIWITAAGSAETFRKAGELGTNVLTHLLGQSVEQVAEKIRIYRDTRASHGYDPDEGRVTLMLHTFLGEDLATVYKRVRQPLMNYLRSSLGLVTKLTSSLSLPLDLESLNEHDMNDLLGFALERYFETSALIGTPATCGKMVEKLKEIGVNEIACLIDFGVDDEIILESLETLTVLKEMSDTTANHRPTLAPPGTYGNSLEQAIKTTWQTILKREEVEVHDNFFHIGGNIQLAIEMQHELQRFLAIPVSLSAINEHPTITTLASYLSQSQETPASLNLSQGRAKKQREGHRIQRQRMEATKKMGDE